MTPKDAGGRTVAADKSVQQGRLAKAKQFLRVADDAGELTNQESRDDARVTLYVHAGIAAADAICAGALGRHPQGQEHREAIALLASVNKEASKSLAFLLAMKTRAGYGHDPISRTKLASAERAARSLVQKASL